jgi:hypothetical protein
VSSLRNGGVSIVFHIAHEFSDDALRLHQKQGKQVRIEVYEESD